MGKLDSEAKKMLVQIDRAKTLSHTRMSSITSYKAKLYSTLKKGKMNLATHPAGLSTGDRKTLKANESAIITADSAYSGALSKVEMAHIKQMSETKAFLERVTYNYKDSPNQFNETLLKALQKERDKLFSDQKKQLKALAAKTGATFKTVNVKMGLQIAFLAKLKKSDDRSVKPYLTGLAAYLKAARAYEATKAK